MQALEEPLHIGGEVERVGNDDDIELLREIEEFAGLHEKSRLRHARLCGGDLRRREVDAGFFCGAHLGE